MGEMDSTPIALAGTPGMDVPAARREARFILFGVPGAGPTGARSRSQWFQSEVTEGLGLKHWDAPLERSTPV
jgi:hypothetical protein